MIGMFLVTCHHAYPALSPEALDMRCEQALTAPWKAERKALRGLGAAHLLMGEDDPALNYMFEVRGKGRGTGG